MTSSWMGGRRQLWRSAEVLPTERFWKKKLFDFATIMVHDLKLGVFTLPSSQPWCSWRFVHQLSPTGNSCHNVWLVWVFHKYQRNITGNLAQTSLVGFLRKSAKVAMASSHPLKEAKMPGCGGASCNLFIWSKRAITLVCSLKLSATSVSREEV